MTIFQIFITGLGIAFMFQLIAIGCWLIQIRKRLERIHAVIFAGLSEGDAENYAETVAGKNRAPTFDEVAQEKGMIEKGRIEWDYRQTYTATEGKDGTSD